MNKPHETTKKWTKKKKIFAVEAEQEVLKSEDRLLKQKSIRLKRKQNIAGVNKEPSPKRLKIKIEEEIAPAILSSDTEVEMKRDAEDMFTPEKMAEILENIDYLERILFGDLIVVDE